MSRRVTFMEGIRDLAHSILCLTSASSPTNLLAKDSGSLSKSSTLATTSPRLTASVSTVIETQMSNLSATDSGRSLSRGSMVATTEAEQGYSADMPSLSIFTVPDDSDPMIELRVLGSRRFMLSMQRMFPSARLSIPPFITDDPSLTALSKSIPPNMSSSPVPAGRSTMDLSVRAVMDLTRTLLAVPEGPFMSTPLRRSSARRHMSALLAVISPMTAEKG